MFEFEFPNNGPFLPVVFCMDISGSMSGNLQAMEEGFRQFMKDVEDDPVASNTVQGAIITFGTEVNIVQDFAPVKAWQVPQLYADGCTNLVGAVDTALQMLTDQKDEYRSQGITYYQPWLVLLTDGGQYPYDNDGIRRCSQAVVSESQQRKLVSFPVGIGSKVNWDQLKRFNAEGVALEMKSDTSFKEFFEFFSQSAAATTRSTMEQGHQIDMNALKNAFGVR